MNLNKANQLDLLKKKILEQKEKPIENQSNNQITENQNLTSEAFDLKQFEEVYNEYIQILDKTAKSRVSSFLRNSKFKLLENSIVELELRSKLELELLEEQKLDMIPYFRSGLKNSSFDFNFIINTELIQQTKKVSKQDLLKIMAEKNPLVSELVQGLGLELEY